MKKKKHFPNVQMRSPTSWAVVSSVFSELSQTVKVLLAVVAGEDGLVVEVVVVFTLIAVIVFLLFSILRTGSLTIFGLPVRCQDV